MLLAKALRDILLTSFILSNVFFVSNLRSCLQSCLCRHHTGFWCWLTFITHFDIAAYRRAMPSPLSFPCDLTMPLVAKWFSFFFKKAKMEWKQMLLEWLLNCCRYWGSIFRTSFCIDTSAVQRFVEIGKFVDFLFGNDLMYWLMYDVFNHYWCMWLIVMVAKTGG